MKAIAYSCGTGFAAMTVKPGGGEVLTTDGTWEPRETTGFGRVKLFKTSAEAYAVAKERR